MEYLIHVFGSAKLYRASEDTAWYLIDYVLETSTFFVYDGDGREQFHHRDARVVNDWIEARAARAAA